MRRIHIEGELPVGDSVEVRGETARYMDFVLRARATERFVLFDDTGMWYEAELRSIRKDRVVFSGIVEIAPPHEPRTPLILLQPVLKGAKMDLVMRMAAELGVARIVPVECQRSVVRETRKTARWRKIVLEGARQAGRPGPPEVTEPLGLMDYLARHERLAGVVFTESGGGALADFSPHATDIPEIHALLGPEGGLTPEEVRSASAAGLHAVTLGGYILRAETAVVVALGLVQARLGNI